MTSSPLLSARLQTVLNQLEKIIDELDPEPPSADEICPFCGQTGR